MSANTLSAILFALSAGAASLLAHADIPIGERNALISLYANTNGANWSDSSGWNGDPGSECGWFGVQCSYGGTMHVTGIALNGNNLTGSLPNLDGLGFLSTFDVSFNALTGPIPSLSGNPYIFEFDAEDNELSGNLPAFDGLINLSYFRVEDNRLSGPIPALGSVTTLNIFLASNNALTGPIPSLSGLTYLVELDLHSNLLSGPIPSLDGLQNLMNLSVGSNQLTGTIPPLSGSTYFEVLDVGGNHLTGTLPDPPATLIGSSSTLCPNDFSQPSEIDSFAWDQATGMTPWYAQCNAIFFNGFE